MGGYSETLNLLETSFPMRGNLAKREPEMLKHAQQSNLYGRIREAAKGRPSFVLHDGPPYANGNIHLGHVINKSLKDFVVRTKNVLGYDATYIPGWDCHGLPIERELEKLNVPKDDPFAFRTKCRAYANEQIARQREQFERLGVLGDWENHYRTMLPATEAKIIQTLGALERTGMVYRALRPVLHCPVCESSLAEAEVEYDLVTSKAIDVAFTMTDSAAVASAFGVDVQGPVSAVIWTTTTWTIPGNRNLVYNNELEYALLKTGCGLFIVAAELVARCLERWGEEGEVLAAIQGEKLANLVSRHPLYDRDSPLFPGDFVTTEEGTGLVHSAPAHGVEDHQIGTAHGMDDTSPVDQRGRYYYWVERFGAQDIYKAVPSILEALEEAGALLASHDYEHEYPKCWRHKVPVMYRSSRQWFVSMDVKTKMGPTLRELSLDAIDSTEYYPKWGRERMHAMVSTRPDWCLSRQRMWNSPVAFFVHKKTGELHPDTKELLGKIAKIVADKGIEGWFATEARELIGDGVDDYEKVEDTLDVWFDSGVTHTAVMDWHGGDKNRPDMYLEGSDQHRGWFMSSLMTACALHGEPPWRQILTHGFVVGGDGKKMSKSAGNALAPERLLSRYGADILRMWAAMSDYSQEIKLSDTIIKTNVDSYRLLRNRIRFLLANLADFDYEKNSVPIKQMEEIDRYMLLVTEKCRSQVFEHYDRYAFLPAMQALHGFCNQDLGRFYLDVLKDILYTLPADCHARRSAQTALHHITRMLLVGLGPVLAFTADEAWQVLCDDPSESTMLHTLEELPEVGGAEEISRRWERVRHYRSQVAKQIDRARAAREIDCSDVELHVALRVPKQDHGHVAALSSAELASVLIVSEVELSEGELMVQVRQSKLPKCERCWRRALPDEAKPGICARCAKSLVGEVVS